MTAQNEIIKRLSYTLQDLMDEAAGSVEYSDWPELQNAIQNGEDVLELLTSSNNTPEPMPTGDGGIVYLEVLKDIIYA